MGRVTAFLGMVFYMYPEKNGRPHVHVLYGEDECVLSIPEGEVLAGGIPGRQLRQRTYIHRHAHRRTNAELAALHGGQRRRMD